MTPVAVSFQAAVSPWTNPLFVQASMILPAVRAISELRLAHGRVNTQLLNLNPRGSQGELLPG